MKLIETNNLVSVKIENIALNSFSFLSRSDGDFLCKCLEMQCVLSAANSFYALGAKREIKIL